MSTEDPDAQRWKDHLVRRGDASGGWEYEPAQIHFFHHKDAVWTAPYGLARTDSGEIVMLGTWFDGSDWRPVVSFSQRRGDEWSHWKPIEDAVNRPVQTVYLGQGNVTFVTEFDDVRYFSSDGGRTWPERMSVRRATNGRPWWNEGQPLVDRDLDGNVTRMAEFGCNFDQNAWPNVPSDAFLRWSYDGGRTWVDETQPQAWRWLAEHDGKQYTRSVCEASLTRAANGRIVAALRTDIHPRYLGVPNDDSLCGLGVSVSDDDGATWSPITILYDAGRHHAGFVTMPNGDLVMTYVVRVDVRDGRLRSFRRGCEAVISHDNGLTWNTDESLILDEFEFYDGAKWYTGACGHVCSALVDDGYILTGYGTGTTRLIRWKP